MRRTVFSGIASAICCALALLALQSGRAGAGDADFDGVDDGDTGTPFFGEAKDVNGLRPLSGVRVKGEVEGASFPIIIGSDSEGKFKFRGFGRDVDPAAVKITCSKDGYSLVNIDRRQPAKNAPVEIECLLEPKK